MKFVPKKLEQTADVSKGKDSLRDWIIGGGTFIVFLLGLYVVIGVVSDQIAARIDDKTEVTLFGGLSKTITAAPIKAGTRVAKRFAEAERIFGKLVKTSGLRELPYELKLVDMDAPNAFAFPGGTIGVTPQLFDWVETELGLAFVLAHELAHHEKRHATRRLGRGLMVLLVQGLVSDVSGHTWLSELALAQYSQTQEYEADAMAVQFLKSTYTNLDGSLEFLTRALAEGESFPIVQEALLSHPPTQERLDRLRELMRDTSAPH